MASLPLERVTLFRDRATDLPVETDVENPLVAIHFTDVAALELYLSQSAHSTPGYLRRWYIEQIGVGLQLESDVSVTDIPLKDLVAGLHTVLDGIPKDHEAHAQQGELRMMIANQATVLMGRPGNVAEEPAIMFHIKEIFQRFSPREGLQMLQMCSNVRTFTV